MNGLGGITAILTALTALTASVGSVIIAVIKLKAELRRRDDVTDDRVDQLWKFYIRRGIMEGKTDRQGGPLLRETGTGDAAMSLELRVDARRAYEPIAPALRMLKRQLGPNAPPGKFAEECERRFGEWLSKFICPTLGVTDAACLAMAMTVAEEPEPNIELMPD